MLKIIDALFINNKEDLHKLIARELNFPSYYGNNLDALYDCLLDIDYDIVIQLFNFDSFNNFIEVFKEAEKVNKHLIIQY